MAFRLLSSRAGLAGLLLAGLAGGCGSGSTNPTFSSVAGAYTATRYDVTQGGTTVDMLKQGASITLTLAASDSSTSGHVTIPGYLTLPGIDADLAGRYVITGSLVKMTQTDDTFIADLYWTVDSNTLTASYVSSVYTIEVILTKH